MRIEKSEFFYSPIFCEQTVFCLSWKTPNKAAPIDAASGTQDAAGDGWQEVYFFLFFKSSKFLLGPILQGHRQSWETEGAAKEEESAKSESKTQRRQITRTSKGGHTRTQSKLLVLPKNLIKV